MVIETTGSAACETLKPISYAYDPDACEGDAENACDSPETVREIITYNAKLEELCK